MLGLDGWRRSLHTSAARRGDRFAKDWQILLFLALLPLASSFIRFATERDFLKWHPDLILPSIHPCCYYYLVHTTYFTYLRTYFSQAESWKYFYSLSHLTTFLSTLARAEEEVVGRKRMGDLKSFLASNNPCPHTWAS